MGKNKTSILSAAIVLTILSSSTVYAQINEKPTPEKVYNDYLYYDNDGSKTVSLQLPDAYVGKTINYYFNEGATIDGSEGKIHATILIYNETENHNPDTVNKFNIGTGKNFIVKQYNGYSDFVVKQGATLEINGGNIIAENGSKSGNGDNTSASFYVENGNVKINADSLWIGNKLLDNETEKRHNETAISTLSDSGHAGNFSANLKDSFIAENVSAGILSQSTEAVTNNINITAGQDITINAFRSTDDKSSSYSGAGIYTLAYHNEKSGTITNLTAKNGNISIKSQGYGLYGYGNTEHTLQAAEDILLASQERQGIYLNGEFNQNSNKLTLDGKNITVTSQNKEAINATNTTISNTSDNLTIYGNDYGLYGKQLKFDSTTIGTANFAAKNGWGICLFNNSQANITSNAVSIDGYTYNSSSDIYFKADNISANGQISAKDGATTSFEDNHGQGTTHVIESNFDAVTAKSSTNKQATINFNTNTIINAYENQSTDYHNNPNGQKTSAIKANSNSNINLNAKDKQYAIFGDIKANGTNANVNINGATGSTVIGDMIADNEGNIDITLEGATLEGRTKYTTLTDLSTQGNVSLNLKDSIWKSRYNSSVTNLKLDNSVIDLTSDGPSSILIKNLSGNGTFNMNLNSVNHSQGDMIYVVNGGGKHKVNIVGGITGGIENITEDNPLRFATVENSGGSFEIPDTTIEAETHGSGVFDLVYHVEKQDFSKSDTTNEEYNGGTQNTYKPSNEFVENILDENKTAENWVITGVKESVNSDTGNTIINMSQANYNNAVYMDRLNKRLGETRYLDGDEGIWVRMRHDKIGKENAFTSKNTMYEIGYDKLHQVDNGTRRTGLALDYMDGETAYAKVIGQGDIKRKGLWLYDTWMGNKGHYADYVLKYGRLENDFDIKDSVTWETIKGNYDNDVFSASTEYGRKKNLGNAWYVEPQAQLQFAHITNADYVTSQGSKVSLDSINSLIARAGFRLGKDTDERSTFYIKGDVMHEFLGDQDIQAHDVTGTLNKTYNNDGTWFDLGFGFAAAMDKNSYIFADFEKSFGNDNDGTYQINVGFNYQF